MDHENLAEYDLFGNRVFLGCGKRGRPKFERTRENANKVSMLLALGWSNSRIAGCIVDPRTGKSISEPTLKRYFRSELNVRAVARDMLDARRFERAWQAAETGNIGAERLLGQMLERNDLMGAKKRMVDAQSKEVRQQEPKLGKKEAALRAAEESASDTIWGDDLEFPGFRAN